MIKGTYLTINNSVPYGQDKEYILPPGLVNEFQDHGESPGVDTKRLYCCSGLLSFISFIWLIFLMLTP
jgi:hypothetical protein